MKIAQINMYHFGSTGKIMLQIAETARKENHEAYTFSTHTFEKKFKPLPKIYGHKFYGNFFENTLHYILGYLFGKNGFYSYFGTRQLIRYLKKIDPEVIHLHNLHSFCVHLPTLFNYLKKSNKKVVWTLHDCWTFTGQCPYFTTIDCKKWLKHCFECPKINEYPKSKIDNSEWSYKKKKQIFTGLNKNNLNFVTPSNWLSSLLRKSFLKEYNVTVINNGIDLNIFRPRESDFRKRYGIENYFILLGVAFDWGYRKGLDVFIKLSKKLDNRFKIVLVGTNDFIDKELPDNIISIHRTSNQIELAEIYSASNLFINPTREDNYPTVNMEAIACGTPVLTFKTGGSPEMIDNTCGVVIEKDDFETLKKEIIRIKEFNPFTQDKCVNKALEFDRNNKYKEYVKLYEDITHSTKFTI